MAATAPHVLQLPVRSPELRVLIAGYAVFGSRLELPYLRNNHAPLQVKARKVKVKCVAKSTEEETELEALVKDDEDDDDVAIRREYSNGSASSQKTVSTSSGDSLSLGIREPVYEVLNFLIMRLILHYFVPKLLSTQRFCLTCNLIYFNSKIKKLFFGHIKIIEFYSL